jgi:3-oxoacyl-[acyl-carrier protein] reductase
MDLGIAGLHALVCAGSRGMGRACAAALVAEGVHVTITGRTPATLETAARELRAINPDVEVSVAAGDIGTAEGRATALAICPSPEILINNNGGPKPATFEDLTHDDWLGAIEANMLAPIALIQAVLPAMKERRWGRIVNITSSAVKVPLLMHPLSNGARSGLTGLVAGLSRNVISFGITINNVLPGSINTDHLRNAPPLTRSLMSNATAGRIGEPEEFAAVCAFLCSRNAGYVTGQNIVVDGGAYPVTM